MPSEATHCEGRKQFAFPSETDADGPLDAEKSAVPSKIQRASREETEGRSTLQLNGAPLIRRGLF
jgi:hypothetical protein